MNIQTTNTPPAQTMIELATGGAPGVTPGSLFQHDGRIWRAVQVSMTGVSGEWVPNADVTRNELPIAPLAWETDNASDESGRNQ